LTQSVPELSPSNSHFHAVTPGASQSANIAPGLMC